MYQHPDVLFYLDLADGVDEAAATEIKHYLDLRFDALNLRVIIIDLLDIRIISGLAEKEQFELAFGAELDFTVAPAEESGERFKMRGEWSVIKPPEIPEKYADQILAIEIDPMTYYYE